MDDDPAGQYLHPEFLLYRALFAAAGIEAVIADPSELAHESGALWLNGAPVDLVYNRLTDFDLSEPRHASLRSAYESGDTVLTPHPRAYALRADKRNLALLSDDAQLRDIGVDDATRATLLRAVPTTRIVDPSLAAQWWSERKRWFFKPVAGFGGRAAYRGDKLTRGVFESILGGAYVAQAIEADLRAADAAAAGPDSAHRRSRCPWACPRGSRRSGARPTGNPACRTPRPHG